MKKLNPLHYKFLRQTLNPRLLNFETTTELKTLTEFVGQERASEAINFGIRIKRHGYNLFAMSSTGIDKEPLIHSVLKQYALSKKTPSDWCYVYNFEIPDKPIAIKLPAGLGLTFQQDMQRLIDELKISILTIFESDEYRNGMKKINNDFKRQQKNIPKKNIKSMTDKKIPHLYREKHKREIKLQEELTLAVVHPFIDKLKIKFSAYAKILAYLDIVQNDIVTHVDDFIKKDPVSGIISFDVNSSELIKYQVNLLVNNRKREGAPVIYEQNPSYSNLISRVEYKTQLGTLITDFTLIKPGALHRANGGFLIIDALKLVKNKHAWASLKLALSSQKIKIEPGEQISSMAKPISLKPKSIPLRIKIILLGNRYLYYKLSKRDPDFNELFKVVVDFDEVIERNHHNIKLYARLIATLVKKNGLKPFHRTAVAAIIDHSTRIADDIEKLSTHILRIDDLVQEADYWTNTIKKKIVEAQDVKRAIEAQIHRLDRSRQLYYEDIYRNFILIDTKDAVIGQVNCLSVVRVGKFAYGHPTRVTAKVRIGKGEFIDIQREIKLAGPIHSKAVLTLANFLADRYSRDYLFSLTASISFEQIYGMLDGDSASIGELCALLSAICEIPVKQNLAVTGSINQNGEIQAIGAVNEKIEGYFDICRAKGLTGNQGVIIPSINVKNLMLRDDVIEAAKAKKFFIYPLQTIEQAIYLLTGIPAGERDNKGQYPKNSLNYKVQKRLIEFSERRLHAMKWREGF